MTSMAQCDRNPNISAEHRTLAGSTPCFLSPNTKGKEGFCSGNLSYGFFSHLPFIP